ncbi:Pyruvate dehydrogenase E1 component subunit beta [Nymphon striatum]|nr:Pyruvate dehydrogenase E1 component subunit beta [Nymphon striatum]
MAIEILMPALSPTMEEGNLAKWLVKEGDSVSSGDIIAEIETDKATMEVEAIDEGVVAKIAVAEGAQGVKVNEVIAVLVEEGEDASNVEVSAAPKEQAPAASEPVATEPAQAVASAPVLEVASDPDVPEGTKMVSMTVRDALNSAMAEEMRKDEDVFIMGEEVAEYQGAYKITQNLLQEFGDRRVVDTPITEHGFAGIGVGAAMSGLKPIVEFMTFNFAMQAIDHIINFSCQDTLYVRRTNGSTNCIPRHVPGLKVIAPYSASDAKGLLKAAIRDPNPVVFLENEILYGQSFDVPDVEDHVLPIGKARIHKEGTDATIVSFSIGMKYAIEAAEKLEAEGISVEIIDLRTIRPLDMETVLNSVKKTNRLVTVEEGFPQNSTGDHIASQVMQLAFDYLDAPVITICGKDVPMPYAENLEKLALPNVDEVVQAVKAVTYK